MRVLCTGPSIAGTKTCVVEKESPGCSRGGRTTQLKRRSKDSPPQTILSTQPKLPPQAEHDAPQIAGWLEELLKKLEQKERQRNALLMESHGLALLDDAEFRGAPEDRSDWTPLMRAYVDLAQDVQDLEYKLIKRGAPRPLIEYAKMPIAYRQNFQQVFPKIDPVTRAGISALDSPSSEKSSTDTEKQPHQAQPKAKTLEKHRRKVIGDQQPNDHDLTMANRKLSDPSKYTSMNAREIAAALGISRKSVYEHEGLEKVGTGTRRRLWTTESVKAIKNSPPE